MKIANAFLEVSFTALGGEMKSLLDKQSGIQWLYQGKEGWSGKNPTLFPLVGNLVQKGYVAKGQRYAFQNHGFVRNSELRLRKHEAQTISFELVANPSTLKVYPFQFRYVIEYTLDGPTLHIRYTIENRDSETMPFGFGLHPGFALDPQIGKANYQLRFDHPQQVEQIVFDPEKQKPQRLEAKQVHYIPFDNATMQQYATVLYQGVNAPYVYLEGPEHGLRLTTNGFPYLAVWHDLESNFVCIEPWLTLPDLQPHDLAFENRPGMLQLGPKRSYSVCYSLCTMHKK